MANLEPNKRRPRIRKSAPTVRERAAAAQAEADKPEKPKRLRKAVAKLKPPVKKLRPNVRLHLPDNSFGRIVGRIGRVLRKVFGWLVPRYFINSWKEVRQVTWTTRKETWRLTTAVFIFALVFGSVVYGVDKLLDILFKHFVLK